MSMIQTLTEQLHLETPTKIRVHALAERLMSLQANLEEEKNSRSENFQAKIRSLESKIDSSSLNFESKFKTLRDQLSKLSSTLTSERASKELLEERKSKELKLVENSLQIDLNLLKQSRKENEVKTLKVLDERLYNIKLDMAKERKTRQDVYEQQSNQLTASIERLQAVVDEESANRQEGYESLNNQIIEEFAKFEDEVLNERKDREDANGALSKMLDDMHERLMQELVNERSERENTEEILLKLLEETCQRVEMKMEIVLTATKAFDELGGVFFNSADKRFFVINGNEVILLYETSWLLGFLIQVPSQKIILACVSPDNSLFAYQTENSELSVQNVSTGEVKVFKEMKNKIIRSFLLVSGRAAHCDLILVTNMTLEFYKVNEESLKFSLVRSYSVIVNEFWFEASEGVLLVNVLNSCEFIPFFVYQTRSTSKFQGGSFDIDDKYLDCDFFPSLISCNYLHHELQPLDRVQVLLARLYESLYVICLEGLFGDLTLIRLEVGGFNSPHLSIGLKPGGYALRVADNLIVLHNYGPQESYVFDIKREKNKDQCMVLVKHRGNLNEDSKVFQMKFASDLDPHLILVADELYLGKDPIRVFTLNLMPEIMLKDYPDPVEKVLFTLKRDKSLKQALDMLKECLYKKTKLVSLNELFNITNCAYKETAMQRQQVKGDDKSDQGYRSSVIRKNSRFADNQVKSSGGMIILLQFDVFNHVFKPYYKDSLDLEYLAQVLITYIYSLLRQELHVHSSHQYLLVKTLIKVGQFKTLQNLFQFQLLRNDEHLAKILSKVENKTEKYPQVFHLGCDMLHRLKKYNELAIILARKGDLYESLGILAMHKDQFDLFELRNIVLECEDLEIRSLALEMIEAFEESEKCSLNKQ